MARTQPHEAPRTAPALRPDASPPRPSRREAPSPAAVSTPVPDPVSGRALRVFERLFRDYHPRDFTLRLWNGLEWPCETMAPRFVWILKHPGAVRRMFGAWNTDVALGESYVYDDFDVEGDLEAATRTGDWLVRRRVPLRDRLHIIRDLCRLPAGDGAGGGRDRPHAARLRGRVHSRDRDRRGIAFHYDRSNEFYALWLDRRMVYSCGYFARADDDLDAAQERKLDHVCRKLRLRPGDRLLDIGCGWGGLVMRAAEKYGARALGITLSEAQAALARERIGRAGLGDRCRVEVRDYRDLEAREFDALVSIGMVEHVGESMLPTYFGKARDLLRPGGVFLNHGIVWRASEPRLKRETFDARYVFPDGRLTTLHAVVRAAEEAGLEVRDVESLREHYALTLRHWVRRLEERHDEALAWIDEPTWRIWRLYMAGAAHAFAIGRLGVAQTLLVKPDETGRSGLPRTREDWYGGAPRGPSDGTSP